MKTHRQDQTSVARQHLNGNSTTAGKTSGFTRSDPSNGAGATVRQAACGDATRDGCSSKQAPGPYVGALFGFCFALAFPNLFMGQTAPGILSLGSTTIYLYYGFSIVAFVTMAALSRRGGALSTRTALQGGATVACVAGAILVMASISSEDPGLSLSLFLIGTPLSALGSGIMLLAWYELIAKLSVDYAMLHYVGASLIAAGLRLLRLIMSDAPSGAIDTAICLMPLASLACLVKASRAVPGLPYAQGETVLPRWEFPWMPVLLLGMFNLVGKFVLNMLDEGDKGYTAVAGVVCYGVLLAVVLLGFKRFPYRVIRYAALPLLVCGMLCQINGGVFVVPGMVATRIAQEALLAFVVSILFDLSFRRGVNALWVFGLTLACGQAGSLAANLLSVELADSLANGLATPVMSALIIAVTVAFAPLTSEKSLAGGWGIEPSDSLGGASTTTEPDIAGACSRAARRYDLTRREEDVLLMRLKGASLKEVEESLCIAHNTVKSHVRHIYAKLGVASLEEAREVVGR